MGAAIYQRAKLEDLCTRITVGHVGPMASEYVEDGIPFLRSQNIHPFRVNLDDVKFIRPEFHSRIKKSSLRPGDVAVVRTGYPGVAAVVPSSLPEANCADLVVITPSTVALDPYYLAAIFNSTWGKATVAGNLVGVAQQHFNVGAARNLEIGLPPLPVQRRIAGVLSAYDDLIENCERRIRVLDEMARSLYREWFVLFRYPGYEKTPLVESPLGRIPKGWEVRRLGDVVELHYGKALKAENRRGGVVPVFASSGLVGWHDESLAPGPGIILGRKGNVGSVFWSETEFFVIDTAYYVTAQLPLRFVFFDLQGKNFINGDSAVPGLSRQQAYALQTVIPPPALMDRFCDLVEGFLSPATVLRRQAENLRKTRDLLLPRLLSGQLSLEDAA